MKKIVIALVVGLMAFPLMAEARSASSAASRGQPNQAQQNAPDRMYLRDLCGADHVKPPAPGVQYNGEKANPNVMIFKSGAYIFGKTRQNMGLVLYEDGTYYLMVDPKAGAVFGTQGRDYISGSTVGGCSREQLSEALIRNQLIGVALDTVPLDQSLRAAQDRENQDTPQ